MVVRRQKERISRTFFVIIKLEPMATVPDTARARPTYLSSTMKKDAGGEGEGERSGREAVAGTGHGERKCDGDNCRPAARLALTR
jgi:hypothetical protein